MDNKNFPQNKNSSIWLGTLNWIECGLRPVSQELLKSLCLLYEVDYQHLVKVKSAEQILKILNYSEDALDILKLAEQKLAYRSKKKISIAQILKELNEIFSKFKEIEKGWLFGSYARGEMTPNSDIDIVIQAQKGFSYFQLADVQFQAEKKIESQDWHWLFRFHGTQDKKDSAVRNEIILWKAWIETLLE